MRIDAGGHEFYYYESAVQPCCAIYSQGDGVKTDAWLCILTEVAVLARIVTVGFIRIELPIVCAAAYMATRLLLWRTRWCADDGLPLDGMASCNSADNLSAVIEAVVMRTNRSARNTRILKTLLKRGQIIVDCYSGKLYKPNGDDLYCRVSETGYVKCEARHRGRRLYFYAHKAV